MVIDFYDDVLLDLRMNPPRRIENENSTNTVKISRSFFDGLAVRLVCLYACPLASTSQSSSNQINKIRKIEFHEITVMQSFPKNSFNTTSSLCNIIHLLSSYTTTSLITTQLQQLLTITNDLNLRKKNKNGFCRIK